MVRKVIAYLKLHLIDDWDRAWKWASVRTSALGILIMGAAQILGSSWTSLPPSLQQYIPHADVIAMILFGVTMVGRLFKWKVEPNGTEK